MKKGLLFFLGAISLFTALQCQNQNAIEVKAYNASEWSVVKTQGDYNNYWTINDDNIIGTNPESGTSNFLVSSALKASGDYSVSVNINGTMGFPNTKETQAGIVPWYVDNNNYVMVYLQWRANDRPNELNQVQVTGRINGEFLSIWKDGWDNSLEWNDWWTDGNTTASNTNFKFTVDRYYSIDSFRYVFYINDQYIGEHGIRSDMAAAKVEGKIGLYSYNDTFTFTNITKGNSIGQPSGGGSSGGGSTGGGNTETAGDWEFVNPANSTVWSLNKSNNTVIADCSNGTEWLTTNALQKNTEGKKDFFMSSTIQVTELGSGFNPYTNKDIDEYKVGLVPYYIDTNNYVIIWLSRWADGTLAELITTAKLNGRAIGEEWRSSGWLSFDITTRVEMEVEISGDTIRVYLNNKTKNPTYTTIVDGLSNRNINGSKAGLNVLNVSCEFSNNLLFSTERSKITELPIITEVTERITTGIINKPVSLPIYTATNSFGEIMDAIVTVTDPDNDNVTISKGRFTPTKLGNYHVKVTCKDSWGNEAIPIEYDILITDGTSTINPDLDNNMGTGEFVSQLGINPKNGMIATFSIAGGGTLLSVIGIIINIILKKRLF